MSLRPVLNPPQCHCSHCGFGRSRWHFVPHEPTYRSGFEAQRYRPEKTELPRTSRSPQKKRLKTAPGKKKGDILAEHHPQQVTPQTKKWASSKKKRPALLNHQNPWIPPDLLKASIGQCFRGALTSESMPLIFRRQLRVSGQWCLGDSWDLTPPQPKKKNVLKNIFQSSTSNLFCKWFGRMSSFFYVFQPTFCFASCFSCSSIFQGVPIKP